MFAEAGRRPIEQLGHGDHVCLLYEDQAEYVASLAAFHRNGLAEGNRCIHIADVALTEATFAALRDAGVDVDGEVRRGAFLALAPEDLYLSGKAFEPESVLDFWRAAQEEAIRAGFGGLHVSGDVTWLADNRAPGLERFGDYEAQVNKAILESQMRALCCYNRRLLPVEVLAHMFRTHPRIVFGEKVLHPNLLMHPAQDETPAEGWLEAFLGQLRQSEVALRDTLSVKEKLFEVVQAAIYTCDAEGQITSFNETAVQLWGREPKLNDPSERFCGSLRLYRPDGRFLPHDETPIAIALRDGVPFKGIEVVIERPDESRVTALAHIAPLKDAQDKVTGVVNCLVDITGRKRMEVNLRQRTEEYYRLLENLPAAAYTCDAEGLVTYFNRHAIEVWGREPKLNDPADRFCGSFKLFWPDGSPMRHDECWMARALQTNEAFNGHEVVIERADGSRVMALAHANPMHDEDGKLVGAVNVLVDITERKRAEEAQARLAAIVESADDAIVSQDRNGVITSWNRGAERLFGYSPEEAIGQPLTMLIPPDRLHEEHEIVERIRRGESVEHNETVRCHKDGGAVDLSLTASPIVDKQGRIVGVSKVARDMTSRKRMEDALRKSQEELTDFLETATLGIHRVGPDGIILWANRAELQMLGYGLHEYVGHHIAEFHADQQALETLLSRLRQGERVRDFEAVLRAKDGSLRYVLIDSNVLWENDEFKYTRCFTRDVTEQRRKAQALAEVQAESERRRRLYEAVMGSTPDLVYVFDLHYRFTYANEALLKMWGRTWEESIGKRLLEIGYEPWHAEMHEREIDQIVATKQPIRGDVPFTGTNGRRMYDYLLVPVLNAEGEVEAVAGTTRDVTERKEAEEALREADRRKDEFLAMLSHELRNPLAPIRNAVDLLRLDEDDADIREEALTALEHQVDQVTHLVNDLLDVSRVTTGRIELQQADIDLNGLVQRTSDAFRSLMAERQHQFSVSLSGRPLWVHADATRLEQIVVNLLSNAAKYTPEGGQVWLTVHREGEQAAIRVKDNGLGMESDLLPRVFELFSQGERALDRRQGGLGLGLSLVKSLVEMHGGTVTAASEGPGEGSEFIVRLPLLASQPSAQRPRRPAADEERAGGGLRVLVVDDNLDAAKMMGRFLARKGYDVHTAYDGPSAIQAALDESPTVVLLDIGLPGMDGYEVAQRIRAEEALQGIVLIAMTGYGQAEDMRRSREAGFDHHLVKPADMSELQRLLRAAADSKR